MPKTKASGKVKKGAKGGATAAKGQTQWKDSHARRESLSATAHGGELARRTARVKLAERLLERAEASAGASAVDTLRKRVELADALIHVGNGVRAISVLQRSLELDPVDKSCARRRLVPLLLRLGHRDEAANVLGNNPDDSAVMACSQLLLALSEGGEPDSPALTTALDAAVQKNATVVWLLAAPRTRSSECTREALPGALVEELRELRATIHRGARPAPGGAEEAL